MTDFQQIKPRLTKSFCYYLFHPFVIRLLSLCHSILLLSVLGFRLLAQNIFWNLRKTQYLMNVHKRRYGEGTDHLLTRDQDLVVLRLLCTDPRRCNTTPAVSVSCSRKWTQLLKKTTTNKRKNRVFLNTTLAVYASCSRAETDIEDNNSRMQTE